MNEDKLTQAAQQLGARAAERLDVEATARTVVERLREQPLRRTTWVQATWLRIAAALVLVVGGAALLMPRAPSPQTQAPHLIADDLRDLSTDELRTLLGSLDQIVADSVVADSTPDLWELDAQELRKLLREG